MSNNLLMYHNIALGVVFVVKGEEDLYKIPPIKAQVDELDARNKDVDEKSPELTMGRFPAKLPYNQIKVNLVNSITLTSDKVYSYAVINNNEQLLSLAKRGRSSANRLSQKDLATLATELVQGVTPIMPDLEPFLYSEEDFQELSDLTTEFVDNNTERNMHPVRYTVSAAQARDHEVFYKERIDKLVASLKGFSREFPITCQNVSNLVNRPKPPRKSAIYATITDENEEPLTSVRMELYSDEDNSLLLNYQQNQQLPNNQKVRPLIVKTTSINGMFLVRTLEAGSYTAFFSMFGYERQVLKVFINPKNTFNLKLMLKKSVIPA